MEVLRLRKVGVCLIFLCMLGVLSGCGGRVLENPPITSPIEEMWQYERFSVFADTKMTFPEVTPVLVDYGCRYDCVWKGEEHGVYVIELNQFIYTGGIMDAEYVTVNTGEDALRRALWVTGVIIAKSNGSTEVQSEGGMAEYVAINDIPLYKVEFKNGEDTYRGYIQMNGYGVRDKFLFYKSTPQSDEMIGSMMETLAYTEG